MNLSTEPVTSAPIPPPTVVIEPSRGWQLIDVRELWRYRELIAALAWRNITVRYKQTVLGIGWVVIQPALQMIVFSVFFHRLAGLPSAADVPYPLFVMAGLLAWNFFAAALSGAANSVVASENLISKVYFPRLAVPFAAIATAVVDFCFASGLLLVMMLWYQVPPSPQIMFAPLVFLALLLTASGVGTLLAALCVTYRDVRHVVPFFVQFGLFATPTIYMLPPAAGDVGIRAWLTLNPLVGLVTAFRASILGGPFPWGEFAVSAALGVGLFVVGCLYFRKAEDEFADVI